MYHYTEGMALEEQIGQLLGVGFSGITPSTEIVNLIQQQHVGSIILFARNVESARQVQELTNSLQQLARAAGQRYPLIINVDQENGMVQRLGNHGDHFPGNMALGAIRSTEVAYEVARATGEELSALGINMNLAPVVDVNNNPANPVIGVRSFGENPQQVSLLADAMVRGYHDAGIITCIKHFPGHGDTSIDSHLALPIIPHDIQRLEEIELVPFKSSIAAGAASVMIAHLYLPKLMQEGMVPSSVSAEIITDLLRVKMGFDGLVITDCLEMKAVVDTLGTEQAAVMAIRAGADLVLISHHYDRQRGAIEAIKAALLDGTLTPERVQQSAERVLRLKARLLSWDNLPGDAELATIRNDAHQKLRDRAYELSTTLVKDDRHLLPIHPDPEENLLLIITHPQMYTPVAQIENAHEALIESMRQRHQNTTVQIIASQQIQLEMEKIQQATVQAALIIVVTVNANRDTYQAQLVHNLIATGKPLIGIAAYNPYDLLAFPQLTTYLVTYEYTQPALQTVVRVLFGEIPACGRLPVSIPPHQSLASLPGMGYTAG
jgi:beta-N-acetylhexosaminidase